MFVQSMSQVGATIGRLWATFLAWISPGIIAALDPGKYALVR